MAAYDLIYNVYQNEFFLENYNPEQKRKVISFIDNFNLFLKENYSDDIITILRKNNREDVFHEFCNGNFCDINYYIKEDLADTSLLMVLLGAFRFYEMHLLKNKFYYYNRNEFWDQQVLLIIIMYKFNFNNMEQYVICTLDRIIKNMLQDNSIAVLYPEYFKNGSIEKEYGNLSMEELEIKYRNEFGDRYDDKVID